MLQKDHIIQSHYKNKKKGSKPFEELEPNFTRCLFVRMRVNCEGGFECRKQLFAQTMREG